MTFNLLEAVRDQLGYNKLQPVNPNTQEVQVEPLNNSERFAQAAIPSMLTGLYKYSQDPEGAAELLKGNINTDWVNMIFKDKSGLVIERIADYSLVSEETVRLKMNEIGQAAITLMGNDTGPENKIQHMSELMANQRNNILPYLPAALQIGDLLNDSTLDDRTNKMEGPISTLMQKLGANF